MDESAAGAGQLFNLLLSPDYGLWGMVGLSLLGATVALVLAAVIALPLAYWLAGDPRTRRQPLRRGLTDLVYALMAMPSVMIGLLVYLTLSHSGPLGVAGLAFSFWAVLLAQTLLVLPLLVGLFIQALSALPERYAEMALASGASDRQMAVQLMRQARPWLAGALAMGYGRLLGETGAAVVAGGNILGSTRTLATGMWQQVQRGEFMQSVALGLVLLVIGYGMALASRMGRAT